MPDGAHTVQYKKSVAKDLRKLPDAARKIIVIKIQSLAINPRPAGSTKLRGAVDLYRVRHTDYRIVYQIQEDRLIVMVIKVGHRREVYRDF
jgi:mRNA interferase RelE/StbE